MIKLIVNADDLGSGPGRDRGIFRCFERGIVTSASLLANGESFAEAACTARRLDLPIGVHLNLSRGRALTGPIAGLTDALGEFPDKPGLRKILAREACDLDGIRRELAAQIERVRHAGLSPTHCDTHQHFLLFPAVTDLILDLLREQGVAAVRLPCPTEAPQDDPAGLFDELQLYRQLAPAVVEKVAAAGFFAPQGLWGMPYLNRLNRRTLVELLERIPDGCWELMVHPGFCDPEGGFSGVERVREMDALIDPEILRLVASRRIHLTHFGACACVS